jgi:flagellar hook protein FlgE
MGGGDTTTPPTVNSDGTITFAETVDNGTTTTVRTITIPPNGGGALAPPVNNGVTDPEKYVAGATTQAAAALTFTTNFGSGNQTINLNLGTFGGTTGVTQFAGNTYSLLGLTQDGVAPGSFSGVTTQANGNIIVNYNNGQTRTIAQVPLVTFNAPDSLQSQNGQSFTATPGSGSPLAVAAGTNGAGNLVTGSIEGSNVDIATEFTNLIVAQQAYSSNAKVVTTADQMLQATLQMVT